MYLKNNWCSLAREGLCWTKRRKKRYLQGYTPGPSYIRNQYLYLKYLHCPFVYIYNSLATGAVILLCQYNKKEKNSNTSLDSPPPNIAKLITS